VVTPGPIVPAREMLARILLESGKPADALREFEAVLAKEPNRYRAFAGAAEAAERAGDAKQAAYYSARVVELAANADTPRAEIARAKRVLGMNM
jgi:Tfp pilus assembly protein PilF